MSEEKSIKIYPSPTADTRTATKLITKEELERSSKQHIQDVAKAMQFLINRMKEASERHDFTKLQEIDLFVKDFRKTQITKCDFTKLEWYQMHVTTERHHLNDVIPEDVNLIDVMERICDCVMAGMARTGTVYSDTISPDILVKAYQNTMRLLQDNTEVVSENKKD